MRVMHEVYRRARSKKQILRTFEVLHKFTDRITPPSYDLLLDNPWETEEEQMETLRMLLGIPKPFRLTLYSLTFFPGTELYERARGEGAGDQRPESGLPEELPGVETHLCQWLVSVVPLAVRAAVANRAADIRPPAPAQLGLAAGADGAIL
jgi:hypothetical protein